MELEILNWIQTLRTEVGDWLIPWITSLGNAGFIWILLAAVLLAVPRTRRTGLVLAAALLFDLLFCNLLLKPLAARIRPFDVNTSVQLLIPAPQDFSFPSGHTAASFAAVAALYLSGGKRLWKAVLLLAVLIAFSRLYLYVHYPTDVLGGAAVGLFCGWLGNRTVRFASEQRKRRCRRAEGKQTDSGERSGEGGKRSDDD